MRPKSNQKSIAILLLPTIAIMIALVLLHRLMTVFSDMGAFVFFAYYVIRLINYTLYFIWGAFISSCILKKQRLLSLILMVLLFFMSFLRALVSVFLQYGADLFTELPDLYFMPALLSAAYDLITAFALCIVAIIICAIRSKVCKYNFTDDKTVSTLSLSVSVSLLIYELVKQIITTLKFISEQLGILYVSDIWGITFDYIFLAAVLFFGYFVSSFYARLEK